jgi:competence protein ComEA
MDDESLHIRYLILIAALLCAVIIGYNAFYVPDASMAELRVSVDSSSKASGTASGEEYVPKSVSSGSGGPLISLPASSAAAASHSSVSGKTSSALPSGKINLNTATAQQLSDGLKGVGDALAQRIVAYREQHGKFRSIDELKNVSGIGEKKLEAIRGSVTVD